MIEYIFNPFTASLDAVDVHPTPEVEIVTVTNQMITDKLYVAANPILPSTERVLINGMELNVGVDNDYTLSNDHIHFYAGVLQFGDVLKVVYQIKLG